MDQQKPTIGRIVHFIDEPGKTQAAIVTHVWNDTCVNLMVFPDMGTPYGKSSVLLNPSAPDGNRAEWPRRA